MIRLRDRETFFELDIQGYEFPSALDYDDANWLTVKIRAEDPMNSWSAKDSCLLTYELDNLRSWVKTILEEACTNPTISFLEGEIAFGYDKNKDVLNVYLDFGFHPKGEKYQYDADGDKKYTLEFDKASNGKQILKSLDCLVEKYPERLKGKRFS